MQNFKSFGPLGAELQAPPCPRTRTLLPPFLLWFSKTENQLWNRHDSKDQSFYFKTAFHYSSSYFTEELTATHQSPCLTIVQWILKCFLQGKCKCYFNCWPSNCSFYLINQTIWGQLFKSIDFLISSTELYSFQLIQLTGL